MSAVSDAAVVRITIADYVANDASGKLNMIGGGLSVIGVPTVKDATEATTTNTAPFGIAVSVAVDPDHYGATCDVQIVLEDLDGHPVQLSAGGPMKDDDLTTVHVREEIRFPTPAFAEQLRVPEGAVRARWAGAVMFPAGLPLPPDNTYVWRVLIDSETRTDWTEPFFVPAVETT